MPDLGPASAHLARIVEGVRDDQLGDATPCPDWTVGDLLDHVRGVAVGFAMSARRQVPEGASGPTADASELPGDWRTALPALLADLAAAWHEDGALDGSTSIAGFEAPAAVVCGVAANELVVHGWDLASATGQVPAADETSLATAAVFADQLAGPGGDALRQGGPGFGPVVPVADEAGPLDRLVAVNGRDPGWAATR